MVAPDRSSTDFQLARESFSCGAYSRAEIKDEIFSLSSPLCNKKGYNMTSIIASSPPALLIHRGRTSFLTSLQESRVSTFGGRQKSTISLVKATGDSSDSSTSLSIAKSVRNVWNDEEDRLALIGLGFAAIVAFWASTNLISVLDKLPLIPSALEFIGILFSTWFVYRYIIFKPNRGELLQIINKSISEILGR